MAVVTAGSAGIVIPLARDSRKSLQQYPSIHPIFTKFLLLEPSVPKYSAQSQFRIHLVVYLII